MSFHGLETPANCGRKLAQSVFGSTGASVPDGVAANRLVDPAGAEDEEYGKQRGGDFHLQLRIAALCDRQRLDDPCDRFAAQCRWEDVRRLEEVGDP